MSNDLGVEVTEIGKYYFVSYNTNDQDIVSKYLKALEKKGIPLWYDGGLHAGQKWEPVLEEKIRDSEAVIIFLSNYTFSNDTFVSKEWDLAIKYNKTIISVVLTTIDEKSILTDGYRAWWEEVRRIQLIETYKEPNNNFEKCIEKIIKDLNHDEENIRFLNNSTINSDGVLLSYVGDASVVEIPKKVKRIGDGAFKNCALLKSVIIPDSVNYIGEGAFKKCESLTTVIIPDSVEDIGNEAFSGCRSLEKITIPNGIYAIGYRTFSCCASLVEVLMPDSVVDICEEAFAGCSSLKEIRIPHGVVNIGDGAFGECGSLEKAWIPVTVRSIGACAFSTLQSDTFKTVFFGGLKEDWDIIEFGADWYGMDLFNLSVDKSLNMNFGWAERKINIFFSDYEEDTANNFEIESGTIKKYKGSISLLKIPDGVAAIDEAAFEECSNLIRIKIPEGVKRIGECAFVNCEKLRGISLPNSVSVIEAGAFMNCKDLIRLELPNGIEAIAEGMLVGCEGLKSIVIPKSVKKICDNVFYGCRSLELVEYGGTEEEWKRISFGFLGTPECTVKFNS